MRTVSLALVSRNIFGPKDAVMPASPRPPVLVTGSHRSGSTWIGRILALDPHAGYIHEPFNRRHRRGICRVHFTRTYTYVTKENEAPYLAAFRDMLAWKFSPRAQMAQIRAPRDLAVMARNMGYFQIQRLRGSRPIVKDPLALFSAPWLAERFGMQVVVAIRHPAAFVASLRSAGWDRFPFADLRDQELLMRERLAPFRAEIAAAAETRPGVVDMGILLWRIFHHQIDRARTEHPDWIFVRHEDLSRDPAAGFEALFARLGLDFARTTAQTPRAFTDGTVRHNPMQQRPTGTLARDSRQNILSWKSRLSPEEIAYIRRAVEPLAAKFYSDADW